MLAQVLFTLPELIVGKRRCHEHFFVLVVQCRFVIVRRGLLLMAMLLFLLFVASARDTFRLMSNHIGRGLFESDRFGDRWHFLRALRLHIEVVLNVLMCFMRLLFNLFL